MKKQYYSQRNNIHGKSKFDSQDVLKLFWAIYEEFEEIGYFEEYFGELYSYYNWSPGKFGNKIESKIFRITKKDNLYPFAQFYQNYSENDLFDVIELL